MGITTSIARKYSDIASQAARSALDNLLVASRVNDVDNYRNTMYSLGQLLGKSLTSKDSIAKAKRILVVSTAEDADFLTSGVINSLADSHEVRYAVFWNNHYQLGNKDSVAPVVSSHYQEGYKDSDALVIVKSVISGSCVVKTNLLALMSECPELLNSVHVASPVMHKKAEGKLKAEFPKRVSDRFEFSYFAMDSDRTEQGEVIPGIGGDVYPLLGLSDQPARIGYIPELVKREFSSASA